MVRGAAPGRDRGDPGRGLQPHRGIRLRRPHAVVQGSTTRATTPSSRGPRAGPHHRHANVTGCGNSVNLDHPNTLRLVLDALRYWVTEMQVDGFRFDLAVTLAREAGSSIP